MLEVIYILCLRQLKHYWCSIPRLISSLGQPLVFLGLFRIWIRTYVFRSQWMGKLHGFSYPGDYCHSDFFISAASGLEVIWDRRGGFYEVDDLRELLWV